jgi:CRP/FNR family transcriptional regulator
MHQVALLAPVWRHAAAPESVFFVLRGSVKLCRPIAPDRWVTVDVAPPGTLLCPSAATALPTHCCEAVAGERGTQVLVLQRAAFLQAVRSSSAALDALMRALATQGALACRRVEELAGTTVERRLTQLLLRLTAPAMQDAAAGRAQLHLTRQDLADLCGTTPETVSRTMRRLRAAGVVERCGPNTTAVHCAALAAYARARR